MRSAFLMTAVLALALTWIGGDLNAQEGEAPTKADAPAAENAATPAAQAEEDEEDVVTDDLFFIKLANKGNATVADGYRATYILLTGNEEPVPFNKVRGYLMLRRVINQGWRDRAPTDLMTYADIAFLVAQAIDLQGGVSHTVTKWLGTPTSRYSFREAVFQGIIPSENPIQYISGAEVISIIQRASEIREQQRLGRTATTAADIYAEGGYSAQEEAAESEETPKESEEAAPAEEETEAEKAKASEGD